MNISLIIRDLLLRNDQLVIPGFGTFKIIHRPAQMSRSTQVLLPPAREIIFDSQLRSDDNLLLLSIKKKHGLSEAGASEALMKYVNQLEEDIRLSGSVLLEGLGKMTGEISGSLVFEPLPELLNPGGIFALPQIDIPATGKTETTSSYYREHKKSLPLPEARRRRKWWIPAVAIIVVVMLVSIGYFTGLITHIPGITLKKEAVVVRSPDQKRIVFGSRTSVPKDTSREAISRQLDQRNARENALRYENEHKKPVAPVRENYSIKPTVPVGPYQIISGSFTLTENAERHILSLRKKGINAEMLPRSGKYYMVTLGSYPTRSEALAALELLKGKLDQDLWVMKIVTRDK